MRNRAVLSLFSPSSAQKQKIYFFKLTHIRILYKNNRKFQFHMHKKSSVSCANSQKCNNNIVTYTYCMSKYYKLPVKRILNLQELSEKCIILSYYIEGFCALFIIFWCKLLIQCKNSMYACKVIQGGTFWAEIYTATPSCPTAHSE